MDLDQVGNNMKKKPVILFEGLDGAGKTYALSHLKDYYEKQGETVHVVDSIPYHVFLESHDKTWFDLTNPNTRYMEYLAWQVNNYYKNIHPYLGNVVILIDRYIPSCYAYNALRDDANAPVLAQVMKTMLEGFFKPDVTFLFDVTNEVLVERHKMTNQPEKMTDFHFIELVRGNYRAFRENFRSWFVALVDGNRPIDYTLNFMLAIIDSREVIRE